MGAYTNKLEERLTDLMKKNFHAEKEFIKAADNVELSKLKTYFINKAEERHYFAEQLKSELEYFFEQTDKIEIDEHPVFTTWIDINSWFFEDDLAMLEEAINGDVISIKEYNDLLKQKGLPYAIKELLKIQKHTIEYSALNIKGLHDL